MDPIYFKCALLFLVRSPAACWYEVVFLLVEVMTRITIRFIRLALIQPLSSSVLCIIWWGCSVVLLGRAHYRHNSLPGSELQSVGVSSPLLYRNDIEFEVKVKGCYLACICFHATYICVFVAVVPTATNHNRGRCWPEGWPGGQLFPRSDTVFFWLLTVPSACWLLTSKLWYFSERASTPTAAWPHCSNKPNTHAFNHGPFEKIRLCCPPPPLSLRSKKLIWVFKPCLQYRYPSVNLTLLQW